MSNVITKKCPKCGAVYTNESAAHRLSKKNWPKYGSPIKKCERCGSIFKDDEFREIAIDGIPDDNESIITRDSVTFVVFGSIFTFLAMAAGVSIWVVLAIFGIFGHFALSDILSYLKRQRFLEKERIESEKRLLNPSYALTLKIMGYNVPKKYLSSSTNSDDSLSGADISFSYKSKHKKNKNKKPIMYIAIYLAVFVSILGFYLVQKITQDNQKVWEAKMEKAELFDILTETGKKMVVYNSIKAPDSSTYYFTKKYLPFKMIASDPSEVGYIFVIDYRFNQVGAYYSFHSGENKLIPAYRVDTIIRIYDRHLGKYLDEIEVLEGEDPPDTYKIDRTSTFGAGDTADEARIEAVIERKIIDLLSTSKNSISGTTASTVE